MGWLVLEVILIVHLPGGDVRATQVECPHQQGDLTEGLLDGLWGRGLAHQIYAGCFRGEDSHAALRRKHQPIVRALKAADADAAETAMTAHLRDGLALHHLAANLDAAVTPAR